MSHYTITFLTANHGEKTVMLEASGLGSAIERAMREDAILIAPRAYACTNPPNYRATITGADPIGAIRLNRALRKLWELPQ